MIDPLLEPEDNSDLLNRAAKNAKRSRIPKVSSSDMPQELQEALKDHIDSRISDIKNLTPIEYRAVSATVDSLSGATFNHRSHTQIAAVCDLLDEMTEGHLTLLSNYYENRRKIIVYKDLIKNLKLLVKFFGRKQETEEFAEWSHVAVLFDIYLDFCKFQLDQAVHKYRHFCHLLDRQVDETLIETGYLGERTAWDRLCTGYPPAWKDV